MIAGDQLPTLRGERVELRWLDGKDIPALFAVFSNPDVMRYWSCLPYTEERQASELLRGEWESRQRSGLAR